MSHSLRLFRHQIRVPYAHTDQMAIVYYANYFVYFEMARSELLREAGIPYPEMEKRGIKLPVIEAHCVYRRPALYDDLLEVESHCSFERGTRLRISYVIRRGEDVLVEGYTVHVCVNADGRPMRPAPEFRRLEQEAE